MTIRPRRSVLYMPGSNARAIEKARTPAGRCHHPRPRGCGRARRPRRRRARRSWTAVKAGGFGTREVIVRINGLDTPWCVDDLAAAAEAAPDAILVPKVSTPEHLEASASGCSTSHRPAHPGLGDDRDAARDPQHARDRRRGADAETRLAGFVMGTNDLAKETRARIVPGRAPMLPWLMSCVAAARAYGLDILDGVYNDLGDADGFARECGEARDIGFDGKTLIHPNQIAPCNAAFSPSADEIAQARQIIAAFELPENQDKGVVALDGRMVERLHADMARRTVAIAQAIAARTA